MNVVVSLVRIFQIDFESPHLHTPIEKETRTLTNGLPKASVESDKE